MSDVVVEVAGATPARTGGLSAEALAAAVRAVLRAEDAEAEEISLAFFDDARITAMNRRYLDRDHPTDVIAFPLHESGDAVLGDLYIGLDQVERQAREYDVPVAEEVLRVVVHGTLHLLGYDHPEDGDRTVSEMWRRQEEILAGLRAGETDGSG